MDATERTRVAAEALTRQIIEKRAARAELEAEIDDLVVKLLHLFGGAAAPTSLTGVRATTEAIVTALYGTGGLTRAELASALGVLGQKDLDRMSRLLTHLKDRGRITQSEGSWKFLE